MRLQLRSFAASIAAACSTLCLVIASTAYAQSATVVRGATIFDSTGAQPVVADVLIEDGRFAAIGTDLDQPDDAYIIDGQGLSLLPGLIDVHVHWTNAGGLNRADVATALILHGVTTATDFHSPPESFAPKRAWEASVISPHVRYTARIGVPGGHGADWADENTTRVVSTPREGSAVINALAPFGPDVIKVFADGWRYGGGNEENSINTQTLTAIVDAAKEHDLPVLTHTVTVDGGKVAAKAGVTAIVHAIQDERTDGELVTLMHDNGVYYAPTLAIYEPQPERMEQLSAEDRQRTLARQENSRFNLMQFSRAGIPVALGTDSGIGGARFGESSVRELELLVQFGLDPEAALIAGTANSAAVLGLKDDRGTIEIGKRADFVLVDGKPWQQISDYRNIKLVVLDGKPVVKDGELVAPQGDPLPAAFAAAALIDDFESSDGKTPGGVTRVADIDNGFPRSKMITQAIPHPGNGKALSISAAMALKDDPHAFVVLPLTLGSFAAADVSAYQGVRFQARGEGKYTTGIQTETGSASQEFEASLAWQPIVLKFEDFQQDDDEKQISLDAAHSIKIGAEREPGETFWLEIDNVEFF